MRRMQTLRGTGWGIPHCMLVWSSAYARLRHMQVLAQSYSRARIRQGSTRLCSPVAALSDHRNGINVSVLKRAGFLPNALP